MKNYLILSLLLACVIPVVAQTGNAPVLYRSFDEPVTPQVKQATEAIKSSGTLLAIFATARCKGIKGQALDLTDDVPLRIPEFLDSSACPGYGAGESFSIQLWIQTKENAIQGTPILSNKKSGDSKAAGWTLGTKENGAWFWQVSDGQAQFAYEPTAQRQAINDGKWHQLTISVDRKRQEMWMYLDGRNVAIYNISGLKGLKSNLRTVIGGSDEYNDWGSRGEWTAFNGKIDEVKLWNRIISPREVIENYHSLLPEIRSVTATPAPEKLKVQTWNIWHGGHRYGQHVGVARVIDVLKRENADIIGLIETYGSGAIIADSLGYYFYLISSNLSIMSRYPIEECIKVFQAFNSGGAVISLGGDRKLAFFDIWLNYLPDVCKLRKGKDEAGKIIEEDKKTRLVEINTILKEIQPYIANAGKIPVLMAGDFNGGSHLDWTSQYKDMHNGMVIEWPVSQSMLKAGFKDSYRQLNPDVYQAPGFTWSPLINPNAPNCIFDRIDYIYYQGNKLSLYRSETLDHHPVFWPSDHGSVISSFYWN